MKKKTGDNKKKEILVLSGGGVRGITILGALHALEEINYLDNINTYVGTSVGSLINTLLCIGYKSYEIYAIIKTIDFSKLVNINLFGILDTWGLDSGKRIIKIVETLLSHKKIKKNVTFKQLYELTKKKLVMTTVCLNDKKLIYLSYENYPDLTILQGIRMSISVPIVFNPVIHDNKKYVDGGVMCNYPIEIYKDKVDEIIGINVLSTDCENVDNFENYIMSLIQCFNIKHVDDTTIKCTINIPCKCSVVNFRINKKHKTKMFDVGYNTAKLYLSNISKT